MRFSSYAHVVFVVRVKPPAQQDTVHNTRAGHSSALHGDKEGPEPTDSAQVLFQANHCTVPEGALQPEVAAAHCQRFPAAAPAQQSDSPATCTERLTHTHTHTHTHGGEIQSERASAHQRSPFGRYLLRVHSIVVYMENVYTVQIT